MAADIIAVASVQGDGVVVPLIFHRGEELWSEPEIPLPGGKEGRRVLVTRNRELKSWTSHGSYDPAMRSLVERVLPLGPLAAALDSVWHDRLDLFENDLGHPDPRLASSAWAVWANALQRVLAERNSVPEPEELWKWIADDSRPIENNLWWILLGFHGTPADHARITERLKDAWKDGGDEHLSAMISARLAGGGDDALVQVTAHYLLDRERTLAEIQEALAALSVRGSEFPATRTGIIKSYEQFRKERRPLAGLVAKDLAGWKNWDAWPDYLELLRSGEPILPSTRTDILEYLKSCPVKKARDGARALPMPRRVRGERFRAD